VPLDWQSEELAWQVDACACQFNECAWQFVELDWQSREARLPVRGGGLALPAAAVAVLRVGVTLRPRSDPLERPRHETQRAGERDQ